MTRAAYDDGVLVAEETVGAAPDVCFSFDTDLPDGDGASDGGPDSGWPAAPADADAAEGEKLVAATTLDVERILRGMPAALLEAKKFIAAELWAAPRPEELQALVKLATDQSLAVRCREEGRTVLSLRLVAEREARAFWDDLPLDPDEIRLRARRMAAVAAALAAFGDPSKMTWGAGKGLDSDDREILGKIARPLLPRPERLVAATVISPRLALLLEKRPDELKDVLPEMSRDEARVLGGPPNGVDEMALDVKRSALHVAAARWLMHDDLFEWDAFAPAPAQPATRSMDQPGPAASTSVRAPEAPSAPSEAAAAETGHALDALDDARRSKLAECLQRLRGDELVYRAVSAQVQTMQDRALKAHRKDLTDLLVRLRRPLMASYTRLAVILRSPEAAELVQGRSAARRAEPSEVTRENVAEAEAVEKIYDEAVTSLKKKPARLFARLSPALRARRRMLVLTTTLAALTIAAGIVLWKLPPAPAPPLAFDIADSIQLKLLSATPIGTMLYAQVDEYWNRLSPELQRERLDDLARLATEKGFKSLMLTDARGEVLGRWDISTGSTLTGQPDPTGP